jgi:hypothetical protein
MGLGFAKWCVLLCLPNGAFYYLSLSPLTLRKNGPMMLWLVGSPLCCVEWHIHVDGLHNRFSCFHFLVRSLSLINFNHPNPFPNLFIGLIVFSTVLGAVSSRDEKRKEGLPEAACDNS